MSHSRFSRFLAPLFSLLFAPLGAVCAMPTAPSSTVTTSPVDQPVPPRFHLVWQTIRIYVAADLRNHNVQRNAYIQGRLTFDNNAQLASVGTQAVLTRLQVAGKNLLTHANEPSQPPMNLRPFQQWEFQQGRAIQIPLPDTVEPGATIQSMQGYIPARQIVKVSLRSVPLELSGQWEHFGRRLTPLSLKITSCHIDKKHHNIRIQFMLRGRSPAQFFSYFGQARIFPALGKMTIEDDKGAHLAVRLGGGGSTSDGRFTGTGSIMTHYSGTHHFTTLRFQVIEKVRPIKLKFEIKKLKIPTFRTRHP